jgi:hypothetical protein
MKRIGLNIKPCSNQIVGEGKGQWLKYARAELHAKEIAKFNERHETKWLREMPSGHANLQGGLPSTGGPGAISCSFLRCIDL